MLLYHDVREAQGVRQARPANAFGDLTQRMETARLYDSDLLEELWPPARHRGGVFQYVRDRADRDVVEAPTSREVISRRIHATVLPSRSAQLLSRSFNSQHITAAWHAAGMHVRDGRVLQKTAYCRFCFTRVGIDL